VDIPENAEHFLLYCKRLDAQRNILYRSLLAANVHIDLNTLLFESQIKLTQHSILTFYLAK
jgi:hypothetical protein